ncbi:MAG: HesB/IscA family protein [Gammaproteobacteria bacterium]
MIEITKAAAEQIKKAAEQSNAKDMPLRVAAKRRDDGSIEYMMGFDHETDEDVSNKKFGVNMIANATFASLLKGCSMDFVELEPGDFQFVFLNPNDPNFVPPDTGPNT